MIIEKINSPEDVQALSSEELKTLSAEIRDCLIRKLSKTGGHLGSNLGMIEITVALHKVFHSPVDKILFDVSHQCYTHKILTGRKEAFLEEAHYHDVSGYSNPAESVHDFFPIGHTSTAISLATGMAKVRDLQGGKEQIVAVIGDASLDGGEAFEALNYVAELDGPVNIVVNDNDMSIPENYGGLHNLLNRLKAQNGEVENNFFKSLGLEYVLVRNGHDIDALTEAFSSAKNSGKSTVIHCCTQKGKGYSFAEKDREKWHWAKPFSIESGEFLSSVPKENYGALVAEHLLAKMKEDPRVVVVAASTPLCIGFHEENRKKAGKQYIDVGIAEQNAITMTAAMAKAGGKPVFATNSTFYQRAYDQIAQEMCLGKCPATLLLSHASVWGHTNDTHVGLYDMALLSSIPNLTYLAPTNLEEYLAILDWSIEQKESTVAIRIPWTRVCHAEKAVRKDYSDVKYMMTETGEEVAILALGSFYQLGVEVREKLKAAGIHASLINPLYINKKDETLLESLKKKHRLVVTLEDGILQGGFGSMISQYYSLDKMKVLNKGFFKAIPSSYVPEEFMRENRLLPEQITEDIIELIKEK